MTLILTPPLCRASYDLLAETQPFNKWNLPDSEDIKFVVTKHKSKFAETITLGKTITLHYSANLNGHLVTLLTTTAHEMIHVYQHMLGIELDHGAAFKKLAAKVCRYHRDFDPLCFW